MISKIIEKQFIVIWFTFIACVLGYFSYQRMPIELLPSAQDDRFAVVIPNPGMASQDLMSLVRPVIAGLASSPALKAQFQIESNVNRLVAVLTPVSPSFNLKKHFQDELKNKFKHNQIRLASFVVALGMHQSPVLTLMLPTRELKTSSQIFDTIHDTLMKRPGIASVVKVGQTETPLLELTPTLNESAQPLLNSRADLLSFLQQSLAPSQVFQSHFKTMVSTGFSDSSSLLNDVKQLLYEAPAAQNELSFYNGQQVDLIHIYRFASENDLNVSNEARAWLEDYQAKHPKSQISVIWDVADYIRAADKNVSENLRDGTLLTCLCVYLFIRRLSQTFLVSISIPISILIAFPLLSFVGISRNIMSLAGIALAVGIVVDTTLSVIDELVSQLKAGRSASNAALRAARTNIKPVLLTSLSSLAVFLPILFLDGFVGTLFYDLSMTFIIAQLTSFIVSIFIMPVLGAKYYSLFPLQSNESKPAQNNKFTTRLSASIMAGFRYVLISPTRSAILSFGFLLLVLFSFVLLPNAEFLPQSRANQFRLSVFTNPLLNAADKNQLSHTIEQVLTDLKASDRQIYWTGSQFKVDFKTEKKLDLEKTNERFQKHLKPYETRLSRFSPFDPASSDGRHIEFFVDVNSLHRTDMKNAIAAIPGVIGQHWSADFKVPTSFIENWGNGRNYAYGLPRMAFADAWPLTYGSIPLGHIYDIAANDYRLVTLKSEASSFHLLPSANLLADKFALASLWPRELTHSHTYWNEGRHAEKVEITVAPGLSGKTHQHLQTYFRQHEIPVMWDFDTNQNQQSMQKLFYCLLVAILLTTLLLYIQQRSLFLTVAVLFTFVWAPAGAIPGLWLHHELLNGSALVGFILLAGSVVNNGILIVEMIQKHRLQQAEPAEACLLAIRERSLNVIITSLTTVFGMLPLVFETGVGSEMYRGLAIVVVYGVLVSTPMSLIGVPCLVVVFDTVKERLYLLALKARIFVTEREVRL